MVFASSAASLARKDSRVAASSTPASSTTRPDSAGYSAVAGTVISLCATRTGSDGALISAAIRAFAPSITPPGKSPALKRGFIVCSRMRSLTPSLRKPFSELSYWITERPSVEPTISITRLPLASSPHCLRSARP